LKLENLLLSDRRPLGQNKLKLIDFGLSKRFQPGRATMFTKVGSAMYVAPEVLSSTKKYSETCDLWSCGVILFIMLSGSPPFHGDGNKELLKQVKSGSGPAYPQRKWSHVCKSARRFVERLLEREVPQRPTAEEALQDAWLAGEVHDEDGPPDHPEHYFDNLQHFGQMSSFAQAARHLVAHRINQREVSSLRAAFTKLDANGDGVLSLEELCAGCAGLGYSHRDCITSIFREIDTDSSGAVDYTEFIAAAADQHFFLQAELCHEAFEVFDQDHNGDITLEELREVLAQSPGVAQKLGRGALEEILRQADSNGDRKIDFAEFVTMLRS